MIKYNRNFYFNLKIITLFFKKWLFIIHIYTYDQKFLLMNFDHTTKPEIKPNDIFIFELMNSIEKIKIINSCA